MITRLRVFLQRGADIIGQEGLLSCCRRAAVFAIGCLYRHENYLLVRHQVGSLDETKQAALQPRFRDVSMRIIRTAAEADALAEEIGFDFRRHLPGSHERLAAGAVAFCALVDGKFAGTGWVATSEAAKKKVDPLPYKVDFANGQACGGSAITYPAYRNRGLMAYGNMKRAEFAGENGFKELVGAVEVRNTSSYHASSKIGITFYARGRLISILGIKFWNEIPLE